MATLKYSLNIGSYHPKIRTNWPYCKRNASKICGWNGKQYRQGLDCSKGLPVNLGNNSRVSISRNADKFFSTFCSARTSLMLGYTV